MNDDHTEHLLKSYPNLYKELKYFECGDGWFQLIDTLSKKLEELVIGCKEFDSELFPYAEQVKEKHGTLRFYLSTSTNEMEELIEKASNTSQSICEVCSEKGEFIYDGWYQVRCKRCSR
jgi:hypothetical protein